MLGILWASWICGLIPDINFGKFSGIILSYISSFPFSLLLLYSHDQYNKPFAVNLLVLGSSILAFTVFVLFTFRFEDFFSYSLHGDSPGLNTGVGCHALLQGICPTQESNWGLLHCRQILHQLSYQESPLVHLITMRPKAYLWASLVTQTVKNMPAMQETQVWYLGWEDPLEKGMATHSNVLTWGIYQCIMSSEK